MAKQTAIVDLCVVIVAVTLTTHDLLQSSAAWEDHFLTKSYPSFMEMGINSSELNLSSRYNNFTALSASRFNEIDGCWRRNPSWAVNRMSLADCAAGYGAYAKGGQGGQIYTVISSDDDAVNPKPGTLRYGATRQGPLWIVFARDMNIILKMPLIIGSYKTIDGRGANIHISYGPCILIYDVHNVIIHGLNIHHCQPANPGWVVWSNSRIHHLGMADGDGIAIKSSRHVWIDHNTLSSSHDGLVDVTLASTYVTISNNRFHHHDKVMLLGHSDHFSEDKRMRVTVIYNHFGPDCGQRMPRIRFGYAHVANNNYDPWESYAIGGSEHPTIRSEGNHFVAPPENFRKQVTRHLCSGKRDCTSWRWKSMHDVFLNGAYFVQSGIGRADPKYVGRQRLRSRKGELVPYLTAEAGSLRCASGGAC